MKYKIIELDNGFIVKTRLKTVAFEGEKPESLDGRLGKEAFGKILKNNKVKYLELRDRMLTYVLNQLIMERRICIESDLKLKIEWKIKK